MDATRAVVREFNFGDAFRAASCASFAALLLVVSSIRGACAGNSRRL